MAHKKSNQAGVKLLGTLSSTRMYSTVVFELKGLAMSVTTVRLQTEVEQQLEAIASSLHRSKSWVINQALTEYIDKQNLEQERWNQTLGAMESAAQGKVVDASEVHSWLNSWGTDNEQNAPRSGE